MRTLYHLTILPPRRPLCEALSQEVAALRVHFDGELVYLNPNRHFPLYVPRLLFGFHKLRQIRIWERELDLHHFYNPDPFPFPVLRWLHRPVLYSITSGVAEGRLNKAFFEALAAVAVTDERSLKRLRSQGLENVYKVRPGIDTSQFTHSPLRLQSEIRLMVGSAPWTKRQFHTKGVDALLLAARQAPHLKLTFLWRGVLADEMQRRVRRMNLEKQVTVLNERVDVNEVLANVHASVTLATASGIVKSYPHSLMESLAAGKPVLVSRAIPMADYVEEKGCGVVMEEVTTQDVLTAVEALTQQYEDLQRSARQVGQQDFPLNRMLESFGQAYQNIINR